MKLDYGRIPGKWKSQNLIWEYLTPKSMYHILIIIVENHKQSKCLARGNKLS